MGGGGGSWRSSLSQATFFVEYSITPFASFFLIYWTLLVEPAALSNIKGHRFFQAKYYLTLDDNDVVFVPISNFALLCSTFLTIPLLCQPATTNPEHLRDDHFLEATDLEADPPSCAMEQAKYLRYHPANIPMLFACREHLVCKRRMHGTLWMSDSTPVP